MSEELYATLTAEQTLNATIAIAKGDKGDKGDAYAITEADKQEIKEALSGDISELKGELSEEKTQRETADSTLQRNIESEASARETADNAINASLASHGSRLNALESYTIGVDSEGYIGVTYNGK